MFASIEIIVPIAKTYSVFLLFQLSVIPSEGFVFVLFGGVWTFSSSSILSLGMDQEIHPSRQGRIDSVKINPSLPMMREWL